MSRINSMNQEVFKLPESSDRSELEWCTAIASFVDFEVDSVESRVFARAINTAVNIAVRELRAKQTGLGEGQ